MAPRQDFKKLEGLRFGLSARRTQRPLDVIYYRGRLVINNNTAIILVLRGWLQIIVIKADYSEPIRCGVSVGLSVDNVVDHPGTTSRYRKVGNNNNNQQLKPDSAS